MEELFYNINEDNNNDLLRQFEAINVVCKKNQRILSSIRSDHYICMVISGHVQIIRNDFNGDVIIIEDLLDNSLFGSILSNITNPEYEIITKDDSVLMVIDWDNIINCSNNTDYYNQFMKNLLKIMYEKVQENNIRIEILGCKTIREKLLSYFNMMVGNTTNRVFYLPFNYSDLAKYLAINRCAMAREIKALKNDRMIEIKGKRIELLYYK